MCLLHNEYILDLLMVCVASEAGYYEDVFFSSSSHLVSIDGDKHQLKNIMIFAYLTTDWFWRIFVLVELIQLLEF